jgi:predicted hotdog family 3-hydroxylacyl-ACP dehydratase
MLLDRDDIATLIPHAGLMCLLDGVERWDEESIRCVSARHRMLDNPLRRAGRLGAACGIEFAAQAMAVHGRLAGGGGNAPRPRLGYLASLRALECRRARLDDLPGELVIEANRVAGDELRVIYEFRIACDGAELLSGRAAVVLDAGQA